MKLILPLSVTIPRKTKADRVWILNLNSYRNTHHMVLNQAKIAYREAVEWEIIRLGMGIGNDQIGFVPPPYHFTYTVFPANKRKFDLANVLPIIQKFTDDALISMRVISDDSWRVIPAINYRFGGIDGENPRCELEIKPLEA